MAEPDPVGRMRIARGRDGVHTGDDDRLPPLEEEVREFEALWPAEEPPQELHYPWDEEPPDDDYPPPLDDLEEFWPEPPDGGEDVEFCGCTNEELERGRTCGQPQCPNAAGIPRGQAVARVQARGSDPQARAEAEGDFGPGAPFGDG